jgi:small conductance mechanosensitive channel
MKDIDTYLGNFADRVVAFLPDLIQAIIYLVIGLLLIKLFRRFMARLMTEKKHDPTVLKFLMDLLTWTFRVLLVISVITKLGVPNSSFVAIIGAAGLAVGLSLQGSLSNFAGGILIILFKPIRVGDYIEAQGEGGTVAAIRIFNTKLVTPNNQVIYLPNGALSNGTIKNYSKESTRKAEIVLGVGYDCNLKHVKKVITEVIQKDARILKEPAAEINIKELAASTVNVQVFVWAKNEDYWKMLSDFLENIKEAFEAAGIEMPYPQRDIHVVFDKNNPAQQ